MRASVARVRAMRGAVVSASGSGGRFRTVASSLISRPQSALRTCRIDQHSRAVDDRRDDVALFDVVDEGDHADPRPERCRMLL
jgi:hypothetical protein